MKSIYQLTARGWIKVRTCHSFTEACRIATEWNRMLPGQRFCVNS